MNRTQILSTISILAQSQGLYGRILKAFKEYEKANPTGYEELMLSLEGMKFKDAVDVVMFFEGA